MCQATMAVHRLTTCLFLLLQFNNILCDASCKKLSEWDTRHPNPDGSVTKCRLMSTDDIKTLPTDVDGLWLELPKNNTVELKPGSLPFMPNLEYLKIDITFLKEFPPRMFEDVFLPKLKSMMFRRDLNNVDSKDIGITLKNHTFSGLTNLENLYLDNLGVQTLEADALDGLTSLQLVDLTLNYLTGILPYTFQACKNLTSLKLSDNFISTLDKNSFYGLTRLTKLDISLNKLNKLTAGPFHHLIELELLIANSNQLVTIEPNTFKGLAKMHYLSIAKNNLSNLDPLAFQGLDTLESLILDHNKMKLTKGQFANIPYLLHLYLAHNDIEHITAEHFEGLLSLTELVLASNKIQLLESEGFYSLPTLLTLDISDNKISSVETDAFGGLSDLETLNIQENEIKILPQGSFDDLVNLKTLYMDQNPWICGCENAWLVLWLRKHFNDIEPNVQFYYIPCSENDPIPAETFFALIVSEHFLNDLECGSTTGTTGDTTSGSDNTGSETDALNPGSTTEKTQVYEKQKINGKKVAIIVCSILAAILVLVALVVHVYCRKRKQRSWDPSEKKHINGNDMIGHKKVKGSSADPESGYLDIVLKRYSPTSGDETDLVRPANKPGANNQVFYVYQNEALSTSLEYIQRCTDINHPKRGDLSDNEDWDFRHTNQKKHTKKTNKKKTVAILEPTPRNIKHNHKAKNQSTQVLNNNSSQKIYLNKQNKVIHNTNGTANTQESDELV